MFNCKGRIKKLDVILSLIVGEEVAWLFVWILKDMPSFNLPFLYWLLPIILPILSFVALWLACLIGKKFLVVYQLAKFLLVGAFFAIFDLIIFNALMQYFNVSPGDSIRYAVFVALSFTFATIAKYFADKHWVFEKKEGEKVGVEFVKFFAVTMISGEIQVVVSYLALTFLLTPLGLSGMIATNIGKILGIVVASAWNFVGYKFVVFKK